MKAGDLSPGLEVHHAGAWREVRDVRVLKGDGWWVETVAGRTPIFPEQVWVNFTRSDQACRGSAVFPADLELDVRRPEREPEGECAGQMDALEALGVTA